MCGIIGAIDDTDVSQLLLDGLRRLEYRGYDSAGIAVIDAGEIVRRRAVGKLSALEEVLSHSPISGTIGIGHTRWATHGAPSEANAHPQMTDTVAVVHNGIVENFDRFREDLLGSGYVFESETDTEVIPALLARYLESGLSERDAVFRVASELVGAYAVVIMFAGERRRLYAIRSGAPIQIGHGEGRNFLCSDIAAALTHTREFTFLEDGDIAEVAQDSVSIWDKNGDTVDRIRQRSALSNMETGKGGYGHYMAKEIFEQPAASRLTLSTFISANPVRVRFPLLPVDPRQLSRISIVATEFSLHAGRVAKYWIEKLARVPVDVEVASEYRYRVPVFDEKSLVLAISQSGETADTLMAAKFARENRQGVVAIVNVPESSLARTADTILPVRAGPEIGVAATKSFTSQLSVLASFALFLAKSRGEINHSDEERLTKALAALPDQLNAALSADKTMQKLAATLAASNQLELIGRGTLYPVAEAGALLLSSIAYINATGQPAGELKHGRLALVDERLSVIALAQSGPHIGKMIASLHEVLARGGKAFVIVDDAGSVHFEDVPEATVIPVPIGPNELTTPIAMAVPLQLLAYHIAVVKGVDIDQPRNLAKSVTVE